MQTLWQDLRYTLRQLRNAPLFALTAILTLALGLGATTAMLAIVDSVLIRPVALPHAERIVDLRQRIDGKPNGNFDHQELATLQKVHAFQNVAAFSSMLAPITTRDASRVEIRAQVSADFFALAGVAPRMGRTLTAADAHSPVAVVNDRFWSERLHRDPRAVGSVIKIQGLPYTVVGVMPPGFPLPQGIQGPTAFTPLVYNEANEGKELSSSVSLIARLKPGVTFAAASQEAKAVYARGQPAHGEGRGELLLRSYRASLVEDEQPALLAALGACLLLLLIGCANAANLQIARGVTRAGEMRVRAAMGASRRRLAQQITTESVVLSALGAAAGLGMAYGLLQWTRGAYGLRFSRFNELAVNPVVFAACAALALFAGVGAALAPAWNATRGAASLRPALTTHVARRSRLSGGLVALQIALTCVLLLAAGLFIRSYRALAHAPFGFETHNVTALVLKPNLANQSPQAMEQAEARILGRLSALPGVEAAASEMSLPYSRYMLQWTSNFYLAAQAKNKAQTTLISVVSSGFTRTLGFAVRHGRGFAASDSAGSQPVCMVSEAFVRQFLRGANPVGQTVRFAGDHDDEKDPFESTPRTIVGVVADEVAMRSPPALYVPDTQIPPASIMVPFAFGVAPQFAVRSPLPQAAVEREIRAALRETAPEYAEMSLGPLRDNIEKAFTTQKLALRLASGFGLLALLLAAIGIYGVLAYSVAQRTREIGIRMALGSTRQGAMTLVLRQAGVMVAAGLAVGLLVAWPAGRAVKAFLYGVTPFDPLTLFAAAAVLLLVCACAAAIPAYRATQVDPMEALRSE